MTQDCIFCKIVRGEIPSRNVYSDDQIVAIEDVNPQAPVHLLVFPRQHYANVVQLIDAGEAALAAKLTSIAAELGQDRGGDDGFRIVVNTGAYGGQTVDHVHLHVLAGRPMGWPPG